MSTKSRSYEKNFKILEDVTESLNKDEIGIDDLVEKTKEALTAARNCIDILNHQRGEFKKLESEFSSLLNSASDNDKEKSENNKNSSSGGDDPF
ncbi:MAG: exodeoxyribonuclease VII small subunit [Acidobacteriota bacterium]